MITKRTQKILALVLWLTYVGMILGTVVNYILLYTAISDIELPAAIRRYSLGMFGVPAFIGFFLFFRISRAERPKLPTGWTLLFSLAFCLFLAGAITGVFRGNSLNFFVGDIYRYGLTWVSLYFYVCCACGLVKSGRQDTIYKFLDAMVILAVTDSLYTLVIVYKFPLSEMRISMFMPFYGLCWALFQSHRSKIQSILCFVLCMAGLLVGGKRGNLVTLVVLSPMILIFFSIYVINIRNIKTKFTKYAPAFAAVILLFSIISLVIGPHVATSSSGSTVNAYMQRITRVFSAYKLLYGKEEDASWQARRSEWQTVTSYIGGRAEYWLFGAGFGAEVEPIGLRVTTTESGKMHHVHTSWFLYFLRNGVFGVLLCGLFWVRIFVLMLRKHSATYLNWFFMVMIMFMFMFIGSFKGNVLIGDNFTTLIAGFLVGMSQLSQERQKRVVVAANGMCPVV